MGAKYTDAQKAATEKYQKTLSNISIRIKKEDRPSYGSLTLTELTSLLRTESGRMSMEREPGKFQRMRSILRLIFPLLRHL